MLQSPSNITNRYLRTRARAVSFPFHRSVEGSLIARSTWSAADTRLRAILGAWDTWYRVANHFFLAAGGLPFGSLFPILPTTEATGRVILYCQHAAALNYHLRDLRVGKLAADVRAAYEVAFLTKRHDIDATTRILLDLFEISRL